MSSLPPGGVVKGVIDFAQRQVDAKFIAHRLFSSRERILEGIRTARTLVKKDSREERVLGAKMVRLFLTEVVFLFTMTLWETNEALLRELKDDDARQAALEGDGAGPRPESAMYPDTLLYLHSLINTRVPRFPPQTSCKNKKDLKIGLNDESVYNILKEYDFRLFFEPTGQASLFTTVLRHMWYTKRLCPHFESAFLPYLALLDVEGPSLEDATAALEKILSAESYTKIVPEEGDYSFSQKEKVEVFMSLCAIVTPFDTVPQGSLL